MKKDNHGWIDPAIARRLMLEYQNAIGIKGGSEIERRIHAYTKLGLHRRTIENWLRDPNSVASPQTLKIILRFLHTAHFQEIVPRTRDYLESDARLHRVGMALFNLYGAAGMDAATLQARNGHLAGWWQSLPHDGEHPREAFYIHVSPVADHPFSKIYISLDKPDFFDGAGIVFPRADGIAGEYAVRLWAKGEHLFERIASLGQDIFTDDVAPDEIYLYYERSRNDDENNIEAGSLATIHFARIEQSAAPLEVCERFGTWSDEVIPYDIGQRSAF